ncbi:hypothetical protein [Actinoplanes sp. NPDC049599]|uniref:hypothetical protein n=1 Tax=Actinoplanes sp. NPDC049599 TaxID=3363903 RepID=UPI0037898A24
MSGRDDRRDEFPDGALVEDLDWPCRAFTALAASWLGYQELPDVDEGILREICLDEVPMAGLVGCVEQRDNTRLHAAIRALPRVTGCPGVAECRAGSWVDRPRSGSRIKLD